MTNTIIENHGIFEIGKSKLTLSIEVQRVTARNVLQINEKTEDLEILRLVLCIPGS